MHIKPPESIPVLLNRAHALAGLTIETIANQHGIAVPNDLRREKGWAGQLLEVVLGATAASRAEPDFVGLGVEMKTIPVDHQGKPRESTFVSTIPLTRVSGMTWETSHVKKKLAHVLWIPIQTLPGVPLAERRVGLPILWQASPEQEYLLQQDWEELTDMIAMGELAQITARIGTYLQVRPKGANNKALTKAFGPDGELVMTLPRGFYLRPSFTQEILSQATQ